MPNDQSEGYTLAKQSTDLEESGYGQHVFEYRPDLGPRIDFFVAAELIYHRRN